MCRPSGSASAIATKPSASSDGSLTCDDIVISTAPRSSVPIGSQRAHSSRLRGQASGLGSNGPVASTPRSANSVPASIRPSISASLWMPATRCMNSSGLAAPSHSALTSATPQRRASRGVAHTMRPDPDQHHKAMAQHRCDDVLAGQCRDAAADPQKQRTVGGRGLAPQVRHRQGEHVVEAQSGRGAHPVRVEAVQRDLALRKIGVDVAAVHRRRDQQRQHPQQQQAVELAARHPSVAQREAAEHQPGQRHHHRAGGGHGQRNRLDARRQVEQPHPERRVLHHRACAGAQRPDGHQDCAGGSEQACSPQRDEFGVVQRGADGPLVAVPAGNRRAEGP